QRLPTGIPRDSAGRPPPRGFGGLIGGGLGGGGGGGGSQRRRFGTASRSGPRLWGGGRRLRRRLRGRAGVGGGAAARATRGAGTRVLLPLGVSVAGLAVAEALDDATPLLAILPLQLISLSF